MEKSTMAKTKSKFVEVGYDGTGTKNLIKKLVRKYSPRKIRPNKFCVICNKQMRKINDYYCSVKCYTKFRLGLGVDYTKIVCVYPQQPPPPPPPRIKPKGVGQIDYTKFNFCTSCRLKVPKSQSAANNYRCPDCNQRLRQKPINILRDIMARFGEDYRPRIS